MANKASATATARAATAKAAPAPAPIAAPMAPLFVFAPYGKASTTNANGAIVVQGWPSKAASGNSIRAYCAQVAQQLTAANPAGFTVAQYAAALVANSAGTNYVQPGAGWGNGGRGSVAMRHATWFCAPANAYCVPPANVQG